MHRKGNSLAAAGAFAGVAGLRLVIAAAALFVPAPDRGFLAPEGDELPYQCQASHGGKISGTLTNLSDGITCGGSAGTGRYRERRYGRPVDGFPGVYVVAPDGHRLRPGATYRFAADRVIQLSRWHVRVEVTVDRESLTEATGLDLIMGPARARTMRAPASMSCSTSLLASQVEIEVAFPEYAQSWRDQLLYRTLVDDSTAWKPGVLCPRLLPGRSWVGIGQDRIICRPRRSRRTSPNSRAGNDRGLWPGAHGLYGAGGLPDRCGLGETPARDVRLRCPVS